MRSSLLRRLGTLAAWPPVRATVGAWFRYAARARREDLGANDPVRFQARWALPALIRRARRTRFGRDHGFDAIRTVEDFQAAVPLRTYEAIWEDYFRDHYPVFDDLTWPGRIPYLALTSGTTAGASKYIPVSRRMVRMNRVAARTLLAFDLASAPGSRVFDGKVCFLGGSTALEEPGPGVRQGDLSAIAAVELNPILRPFTFPGPELALEPDWDRKLDALAARSLAEPITLVSGVPSWLLALFARVLEASGRPTIAEAWPMLEVVVHGGVAFGPYRDAFAEVLGSPRVRLREAYACSEGFLAFGDPATGLLRLVWDCGIFYEFVPVAELGRADPTRHWLGNAETGVDYAVVVSTCAGLWAHVIGDVIRFESLRPPLLRFVGRTSQTLSAFGEHLIVAEVESAMARAASTIGASVRDWHAGPVFRGPSGHHLFVVEFFRPAADLDSFRRALDAELALRNADYRAHRAAGAGLPMPAIVVVRPGGFEAWMRSRGRLGGQNKVPRLDGQGPLTSGLVAFLRDAGLVAEERAAGP